MNDIGYVLSTWSQYKGYHYSKEHHFKVVPEKIYEQNEYTVEEKKLCKDVVSNLNSYRADGYNNWITVLSVIKNVLGDDGLELALSFSEKCPEKFDALDIENKFYNIKPNPKYDIDVVCKMLNKDSRNIKKRLFVKKKS